MMKIKHIAEWQKVRKSFSEDKTIGFVPTMGCFHAGHAALMERCVKENDISVVSVFVNPLQFNDVNDYKNYPSTLEEDVDLAEKIGIDYLLMPQKNELYPCGGEIVLSVENSLSKILEGEYRPGHFNGVLTVVMKFFQLVRANRAYFGEKDYQQLCLIKQMADAYFIPVEIISCETMREKSDLPFSSRNLRLLPEERALAEKVVKLFRCAQTVELKALKKRVSALGVALDYLEIFQGRLFIAFRVGNVRLIDNMVYKQD